MGARHFNLGLRRRNLALFVFLLSFGALAGTQQLQLQNTAKYVGGGRYDWTIFVMGDSSVLDRIRYVEYSLHPSFPNPVRQIYSRNTNFALKSNGWGEFLIRASIVFRDGTIKYLQRRLRLKDSLPSTPSKTEAKPSRKYDLIKTANTSRPVGQGRWDWKVFVIADEKTLNEIKCVEYTLHPTFQNSVRRICRPGSLQGQGFSLSSNGWGTFTIGIEVLFRDGQSRFLKHELRFGQ